MKKNQSQDPPIYDEEGNLILSFTQKSRFGKPMNKYRKQTPEGEEFIEKQIFNNSPTYKSKIRKKGSLLNQTNEYPLQELEPFIQVGDVKEDTPKNYKGNFNQQPEMQYAYGGSMKKFKKRLKLGGYTTDQLFSTTNDGVNTDQNLGKDLGTAGALYGMQTQVNDVVGNMAVDALGDNPRADFASQELQRMKKFQPFGVAGALVGTIGVNKRLNEFDDNQEKQEKLDMSNNAEANYLSGYAQDARVTFATGGMLDGKKRKGFLEKKMFKDEYQKYSDATGNSPNPNDIEHYYNYEDLYDNTGSIMMNLSPDGHLPSEYKTLGHPNRFINGKDTTKEFATGGNITEIEGPNHEQGGVELTDEAEAEGGEVKADDFILSDRIGDKNGTFAEQMKKEIKKGSPMRDSQNDPYSKFRIMNKKNQLVAMNKEAIADMENIMMSEASGESPKAMMAMGGYLKKRKLYGGGSSQPIYNPSYGTQHFEYDESGTPISYSSNVGQPTVNYLKPDTSILGTDADGNEVSINPNTKEGFVPEGYTKSNMDFGNNSFGIQPEDYASMGVQALSGLSQLYYGLKGPDKVRDAKLNLARASKLNYTPSKRIASQEIDTAFNVADNDLRNNAPGAGSYLSNRIASGVKRARVKGEQSAKFSELENNSNAQIQNQVNQYNSQVLNQENLANLGQEDKMIQEKDAARMAVTEGLNNIGQSVGQGVRDVKSYDMQKLKAKWAGTKDVKMIDGVKYYKQRDGSYKPE